uniref:Uncharacterized protein n=1 Tax=Plectus sambesii TaxID=2011161 RepID=A0A914W290_9BILA
MTIAKPVVIEEEDGVREQVYETKREETANAESHNKHQMDSSEESVEDGDESQSRKKRQLYLEGDDNDEASYDNGNDWDNGEQVVQQYDTGYEPQNEGGYQSEDY